MRWRLRIATRGAGTSPEAPARAAEGEAAGDSLRASKISRNSWQRVGFGLVFVIGLFVAVFSDGGYADYRRLNGRVAAQERRLETRRQAIDELQRQVDALRDDAAARERVARERPWAGSATEKWVFLLPEGAGPR